MYWKLRQDPLNRYMLSGLPAKFTVAAVFVEY